VIGANLFQQEGYLHVDAPFADLAILDNALDILQPGAFDLVERGVGTLDSGINGIFYALGGRGGEFDDFCNCGHGLSNPNIGFEVFLGPMLA
jgi:hypothetical protein